MKTEDKYKALNLVYDVRAIGRDDIANVIACLIAQLNEAMTLKEELNKVDQE